MKRHDENQQQEENQVKLIYSVLVECNAVQGRSVDFNQEFKTHMMRIDA
jgi:hypothetical protein